MEGHKDTCRDRGEASATLQRAYEYFCSLEGIPLLCQKLLMIIERTYKGEIRFLMICVTGRPWEEESATNVKPGMFITVRSVPRNDFLCAVTPNMHDTGHADALSRPESIPLTMLRVFDKTKVSGGWRLCVLEQLNIYLWSKAEGTKVRGYRMGESSIRTDVVAPIPNMIHEPSNEKMSPDGVEAEEESIKVAQNVVSTVFTRLNISLEAFSFSDTLLVVKKTGMGAAEIMDNIHTIAMSQPRAKVGEVVMLLDE